MTTIDGIPADGRVLVTGAGGQIGSAVTERLLAAGHPVTAFDRDFADPCPADRVITGDATSETDIAEAMTDAVGVVHLAAIPGLGGADPYPLFRLNTDATFNVLQAAADRGVRRTAIASSIQATGIPNGHHDVLPAYYPIDEDLPADVGDAYSLSKQVDEGTAQMIVRLHELVVVAFRFPFTTTVDNLRDAARSAVENPSAGRAEGWSYLDVRDAAEAARLALVTPLPVALHVIGLAAPDNLPGLDAAQLAAQHAPQVEVRGTVTGTMSLCSTARAAELLGWRAGHVRARESTGGPESR